MKLQQMKDYSLLTSKTPMPEIVSCTFPLPEAHNDPLPEFHKDLSACGGLLLIYCEAWMEPILIGLWYGVGFRNDHARSFILYDAPRQKVFRGAKYTFNHSKRGMDETCYK